MQPLGVPQKWRPSLALLIALVVGVLVVLPFIALIAARVTSNQFVRETEANLHAQAAIYAAAFAGAYAEVSPAAPMGMPLTPDQQMRVTQDWHPIEARLVATTRTILPPRPDPRPLTSPPDPVDIALGERLTDLARNAQKTTLVGFYAVDAQGRIIARSGDETGSLAHVPEVARALAGDIQAVARWRQEEYRNHSLRSISRDTKFRVHVAHPVIVDAHVVGAVYLSRTPSNLNKYLFQQRQTFVWLAISILVAATLIGLFLWRFLTRPLHQLRAQAHDIAMGEGGAHLPSYGVRELADLGQSLIEMAATLRRNTDALQSYTKHVTHELKSPVTSIMGAAELLEAPKVQDARRLALASAIQSDAARMNNLLGRMREMAKGQTLGTGQATTLTQLCPPLAQRFAPLAITTGGATDHPLPLPHEAAMICFGHLLENAIQHGAGRVDITFDPTRNLISVRDDGHGISAANLANVTEPFFTTRRSEGGTGMGLTICAEIIAQFGGALQISNRDPGTEVKMTFEIRPKAETGFD